MSESPHPAALQREFAAALAQEILRAERRTGERVKRAGLADRIHVSRGSIYAYLNGNTLPPSDVFDRLLVVLAITGPTARRLCTLRDEVEIARRSRGVAGAGAGEDEGVGVEAYPGPRPQPRQLVVATGNFVGRLQEQEQLDGLLDGSGGTTANLVAIVGTAGVGKTALALRWAHRVKDRYPDGQLFANLRGFDPRSPARAGQVLHRFLEALGVGAAGIPADTDAKAALYRSILAGQRVLVVLDNIRSAEQVRLLIPGAAGCLTVVTSRDRLDGLVVHEGGRRLALDVLRPAEAVSLVAGIVGRGRVEAELAATYELASLVSHLPIALTVVAANAANRPATALAGIADELRKAERLPAVLTPDGDASLDLRAAFRRSHDALPAAAARLFRLLGTHPGPDFTIWSCAALLGTSAPPTAELASLVAAHLVHEPLSGRFGQHDLLRSYAAERADALPDAERLAATRRLLDHYAATAAAACERVQPSRPPPLPAGWRPAYARPLEDHAAAMAWFHTEWPVLRSMVETAVRHRLVAQACAIAWTSTVFLRRTGRRGDRAEIHRIVLGATRDADDRSAHATTLRLLGDATAQLGHHGDAIPLLHTALAECHALGEHDGVRQVHLSLTRVHLAHGGDREALEHADIALRMASRTNPMAVADGLTAVATVRCRVGRHAEALSLGERARALYAELGHAEGEANILKRLGDAELSLGAYESALARYESSLALDRLLGDRYREAQALDALADTHAALGRPRASRARRLEALHILEDLHHPDAVPTRARLHHGDHGDHGDHGVTG
ncbi:tetratricopeptide repeat protein [Streptomycetaceae bacterium NBC_01309]